MGTRILFPSSVRSGCGLVVRGEECRGRSCGDENTLPFISEEWVWLGGGGVRREGGWRG